MSVSRFFKSTVGKKVIMGATGLLLVGFVIEHIAGNMLVYAGPKELNAYAALLHASDEVLWGFRLIMLAAVGLHVWAAMTLTQVAGTARPHAYGTKVSQASTFASKSMRVGGVTLLAFIIFHLLHLTAGVVQPELFKEGDCYGNLVRAMRQGWVAAIYIGAMLPLGAHLFHGAWAAFRSLGIAPRKQNPLARPVALVVALLVWAGFTSIPLTITLGLAGK